MKMLKIIGALLFTASLLIMNTSLYAQKSGGTMVFLVQPEAPSMAG